MDYGIKGRKAIACAASQGLGRGCAIALAREGVDLTINARTATTLEAVAEAIRRETGVSVVAGARRYPPRGRPRRSPARLPGTGHPGQHRRGPADRRLSRLGRGRVDR